MDLTREASRDYPRGISTEISEFVDELNREEVVKSIVAEQLVFCQT